MTLPSQKSQTRRQHHASVVSDERLRSSRGSPQSELGQVPVQYSAYSVCVRRASRGMANSFSLSLQVRSADRKPQDPPTPSDRNPSPMQETRQGVPTRTMLASRDVFRDLSQTSSNVHSARFGKRITPLDQGAPIQRAPDPSSKPRLLIAGVCIAGERAYAAPFPLHRNKFLPPTSATVPICRAAEEAHLMGCPRVAAGPSEAATKSVP